MLRVGALQESRARRTADSRYLPLYYYQHGTQTGVDQAGKTARWLRSSAVRGAGVRAFFFSFDLKNEGLARV